MHDTALLIGTEFLRSLSLSPSATIIEIGAADVNGTLRQTGQTYVGLDLSPGAGVDVVISPTTDLPIKSETAEVVISTSQLEHDGEFWTTFLELVRITKNGGYIYINTPSNGSFHRHSEDYWRFYPDAGKGLERWARKKHHELHLIESFTAGRLADQWNDFVCVFIKGDISKHVHSQWLSDKFASFNVWRRGATELASFQVYSEDQEIIQRLTAENLQLRSAISRLEFIPTKTTETNCNEIL